MFIRAEEKNGGGFASVLPAVGSVCLSVCLSVCRWIGRSVGRRRAWGVV